MAKKEETDLTDFRRKATSRRKFMKLAGVAGAGAVAGATLLSRPQQVMAANGINDFDILNFALNLEYLEAEFYTLATTGKTLAQSGFTLGDSGTHGTVTGGIQVDFSSSPTVGQIAKEIALDEQTHVKYLRAAIVQFGGTQIAEPYINLGALGIGLASVAQFLVLARAFEDVGVTAYGGQLHSFLTRRFSVLRPAFLPLKPSIPAPSAFPWPKTTFRLPRSRRWTFCRHPRARNTFRTCRIHPWLRRRCARRGRYSGLFTVSRLTEVRHGRYVSDHFGG